MTASGRPERVIESYLVRQCRRHAMLCLKFVSPARGGVPDRVVIAPSGTIFVEVKRPGETPTTRQRLVHAKLRRYGAVVHVVDDERAVDEVIAQLLAHAGAGDTGWAS